MDFEKAKKLGQGMSFNNKLLNFRHYIHFILVLDIFKLPCVACIDVYSIPSRCNIHLVSHAAQSIDKTDISCLLYEKAFF